MASHDDDTHGGEDLTARDGRSGVGDVPTVRSLDAYRAHLAAIAAKDELIVELRRRVDEAERRVAPADQAEEAAPPADSRELADVADGHRHAYLRRSAGDAPPRRPWWAVLRSWFTRGSEARLRTDDALGVDRLVAFSDGVFAFAITLLVLGIAVPTPEKTAHLSPVWGSRLLGALTQQWPAYVSYLLSFAAVGVVWVNHHTMFSYIKRADQMLIVLNLLLLLTVALIPFPAALLAQYIGHPHDQQVAVLVYSGTFALGGVAYNLLWRHAARGHRLLDRDLSPRAVHTLTRRYLLGPALYGAAFLLGLWSGAASITACIALAVLFVVPGFAHRA